MSNTKQDYFLPMSTISLSCYLCFTLKRARKPPVMSQNGQRTKTPKVLAGRAANCWLCPQRPPCFFLFVCFFWFACLIPNTRPSCVSKEAVNRGLDMMFRRDPTRCMWVNCDESVWLLHWILGLIVIVAIGSKHTAVQFILPSRLWE